MLVTFLDKLSSFFDRRFIVGYWTPAIFVLALGGLLVVGALWGVTPALAAWLALTISMQLILGLLALVGVTALAYLLQAFTTPLIRLYEGYWPRWAAGLAARGVAEQRARLNELRNLDQSRWKEQMAGLHKSSDYRDRYFNFPRNSDLLKPTALGNVMVAAEEYPFQVYRLDSVLWWPRLSPLLPEALRGQIDGALTPLITLLNLSALFALFGLGGGLFLVLADLLGPTQPLWLFLLTVIGGLLPARLGYQAAVAQAVNYGSVVRVAYDLHRHDILKQMHIPTPDSLFMEWQLWETLNQWALYYVPPWDLGWPPQEPLPPGSPLAEEKRFHYDSYKPPQPPAEPQPIQVVVTVQGAPSLHVQHEEVSGGPAQ